MPEISVMTGLTQLNLQAARYAACVSGLLQYVSPTAYLLRSEVIIRDLSAAYRQFWQTQVVPVGGVALQIAHVTQEGEPTRLLAQLP